MGFHNHHYPRPLVPNTQDPAAVDFRAFYPYTPNEVKHRKRTTSQQLKVLEAIFKKDTKPNAQLRQELASELNMTARGVQVWFQNRRAKEKAKAGRASLAAKGTSALDESREEDVEDETLLDPVKLEATSNDFILHEEIPSEENKEQPSASPSPPSTSDSYPPSHAPSPPELHLITDASAFHWSNNDLSEPPPDSAASYTSSGLPTISAYTALQTAINTRRNPNFDLGSEDLYSLRRGSLPVTNALRHHHDFNPVDPLVRRCSVDTSLQRLALHPYANFARAKNSVLYGAGVGVAAPVSHAINGIPPLGAEGSPHPLMNRLHYGSQRLQRRFVSSSALSTAAQYGTSLPSHAAIRRFSMDSRAPKCASLQRIHNSPSPSPLSTYSATIRASLPEPHLYSFAARHVASPIPGPLPMPGFQFGAASSTSSVASPSSADSERNSPDSLRSFPFGGEEETQPSTPYEAYTSRFGSVASLATSESSLSSAYYGGTSSHMERRDSTSTAQYCGTSHNVDAGHTVEYTQNCPPSAETANTGNTTGVANGVVVGYSPPEEYVSYAVGDEIPVSIPDMHMVQREQSESLQHQQVYASPMSPATVAAADIQSPHGQDAQNIPISTTSELAFALDSKNPELSINTITQPSAQEAYVNYCPTDHPVDHSPIEQYNPPQPATFYTAEGHVYHQHLGQPGYPTTYPFTSEMQTTQQPPNFGMLPSGRDYSDPLAPPHVLDNGLQSVEAFDTYS